MKKIGPRTRWIAAVAAVLGIGAAISIAIDSWRAAMAFSVALQLVTLAVVVLAARKRPRSSEQTTKALRRLARAVDNVSLRVVNESQAIQRELDARRDDVE